MYFGLYSQSGIHLYIGYSYQIDFFAKQSLQEASENQGKPKPKKRLKKQPINADNCDYLIEKLMARGPPSKRGEFSQVLKVGLKAIVQEEFVLNQWAGEMRVVNRQHQHVKKVRKNELIVSRIKVNAKKCILK